MPTYEISSDSDSSDHDVEDVTHEPTVIPLKKLKAEEAALEAQLDAKRKEVQQRIEEADARQKQNQTNNKKAIEKELAEQKEHKAQLEQKAREQEKATRERTDDQLRSMLDRWHDIHGVVQEFESLHDMQSAIRADVCLTDIICRVDQAITDKPVQLDEEPLPKTFEEMVKESEKWLKQSWVDLMMASASMKQYILELKKVLKQKPFNQTEEVLKQLTITPFKDQVKQDEALKEKDATIQGLHKEIEDLKARVQGPKVPKVSVNRPKVLKAPVKGPEVPKAPVKGPNEKKRKLDVQGSGNDAKKLKTGPNPIFFGSVMKPTNTVYKVVYQGLRTKGKKVPKGYQRILRTLYLTAVKNAFIADKLQKFPHIRSKYGAPKHNAFRDQILQKGIQNPMTCARNLKKIILAGLTKCGENTYNFTHPERELCDRLAALWKSHPPLQPSFEITASDMDTCLDQALAKSLAMQQEKSKDQPPSATPANKSHIPSREGVAVDGEGNIIRSPSREWSLD